jgi:hypothetical protein
MYFVGILLRMVFSLSCLYNALIQHDVPVDNNKKTGKMKIPLKIKVFCVVFASIGNFYKS